METLITLICEYGFLAPWIACGLLLLAGLCIPISEDVVLIVSGGLASTCVADNARLLFFMVFLGSWLSAWEAYWIGRMYGPKIYTMTFFSHFITAKRIEKLHHYYEKFGIFTFIIGRFIPGGVRNALFMTSGLGKMPFPIFILRDGIACLISTTSIFSLGYAFGANYQRIVHYFKRYEFFVTTFIIIIVLSLVIFYFFRKKEVIPK